MNKITLIIVCFIAMVLAQLYVPASMILGRENTLKKGIAYRFHTAPVDPTDPFRGKYIILNYRDDRVPVKGDDWHRGEDIYVKFTVDDSGFVAPYTAVKTEPGDEELYVKAKAGYLSSEGQLRINYPFDRYYMEESKAYEAEVVHRESRRDTTINTYAVVNILDGDAVLSDVQIDGKSIKEIVAEQQKN